MGRVGIYAVSTLDATSILAKGPPLHIHQSRGNYVLLKTKVMYPHSCSAEWGHPFEKPSWGEGGPQPSSSFLLRGQSQFPDSLVEVLTWLWAAVWGREAGQMSRSPGEEAAPWEGGQGFWPGKTTSSPFDLALSVWSWAQPLSLADLQSETAPVPVCD
jgi:hypothetical protein